MISLIKPTALRYCQQNILKLSVLTNYHTCSSNYRYDIFNKKSYSRLDDNVLNKYLTPLQNIETSGFHTSQSTHSILKKYKVSEKIKEAKSVLKDINFKDLSNAPSSTLIFGLGGLIPFVAAPLSFIFLGYNANIAFAQLVYGGTILAFVGGVKWGYALGKDKPSFNEIGLSVIPSLTAWVGLLLPQSLGTIVISTGLGAALYIDLLTSNYPSWFRALRSLLTSTAIVTLLTTLICSF